MHETIRLLHKQLISLRVSKKLKEDERLSELCIDLVVAKDFGD